jgi:hypothetical protein
MRRLKIKHYNHRIELRRLAESLDIVRHQLMDCGNCAETPGQIKAYNEAFTHYQALRVTIQKLGV